MIDTELTPRPISPAQRTLGWVGLWAGSACLLPLFALWTHSFNPQRPLRLPHPGTSLFWIMAGLDVLMASLLTFSQWQDQKKPKKRKLPATPPTPKNRWRPFWAGGLILGFLVLRIMAANPGAAVNWGGVLGGAAGLVLLTLLMTRCAKLTQPPQVQEETVSEAVPLSLPTAPVLPLGVRPPSNKYRAEVSAREVIYQRPSSARIAAGVGGLFFASLCGGCVWFTLVALGLVFASGMRENPALALMMGGGSLFFLSAFVSILATTGPRNLRVSPVDRSYIYRVCSPVRWAMLTGWAGKSGKDELGIPWQVLEYRGSMSDIAGIQRIESTYKSNTSYTVFLCWREPGRPPMRVGFSTDKDKARAMQAQAAEDLGVPLLPDMVI